MTRKEAARITAQENSLMSLGFMATECDALRRISMTLHRWHERECGTDGGCIERDDSGRAYWLSSFGGLRTPIRDMESGALRRLADIVGARNARRCAMAPVLTYYVQTDPRGAALYILRPGDVPEGADPASCYSRGICVH
jgi:hypothetical protein